jgi:hypothetical protein
MDVIRGNVKVTNVKSHADVKGLMSLVVGRTLFLSMTQVGLFRVWSSMVDAKREMRLRVN